MDEGIGENYKKNETPYHFIHVEIKIVRFLLLQAYWIKILTFRKFSEALPSNLTLCIYSVNKGWSVKLFLSDQLLTLLCLFELAYLYLLSTNSWVQTNVVLSYQQLWVSPTIVNSWTLFSLFPELPFLSIVSKTIWSPQKGDGEIFPLLLHRNNLRYTPQSLWLKKGK